MTEPFGTDPAGFLRATGLLRSFMAGDYDHCSAVLEAMAEDPDKDALNYTFSALVYFAAAASNALVSAGMYEDVDQALTEIGRLLVTYRRPTDMPD